MFKIDPVRIVAALLIILIGSAFSEDKRSRIWSWRIVSWLEREELMESQSSLWYSLTLIGGIIYLFQFIRKSNRMAEWSEERSLFRDKFWILLKITGEDQQTSTITYAYGMQFLSYFFLLIYLLSFLFTY